MQYIYKYVLPNRKLKSLTFKTINKMERILMELCEIKELLKLSKPVWTLEDFCLFAGISTNQGYKLTSAGRIKFYRPFGKKIYIDREEAITALKQHSVEGNKNVESLATNTLLTTKKYNYGNSI